jgi:hypothetical protein
MKRILVVIIISAIIIVCVSLSALIAVPPLLRDWPVLKAVFLSQNSFP